MLDNAIRAGAMLDWITPLLSLIHKVIFRAVGYNVPEACAWSLYQIRDLLKSYGIRAHFLTIFRGTMTFNVSRKNDWQAQGIMSAYGIPYTGGRQFKRPPFLPGTWGGGAMAGLHGGQPGQGQPPASPATGQPPMPFQADQWTAQAAANLQARRTKRGG